MKYLFSVLISFLTMAFACGQPAPADRPQLENPEFDKKLENTRRCCKYCNKYCYKYPLYNLHSV